MEDYPRNLKEFDVRFRSEETCREYLLELRWPDGFCCPRCGCRESSPVRTVLLRCRECRHQTSVTAGTTFQDTRTSLRLWFQAMWWVTTQKNGASALGLQRVLGLKRYETAWTMLHKLRRAMVRPGRDLLDEAWQAKRRLDEGVSNSEIDQIYRCGKEAGSWGGKVLGAGGGGFMLLFAPPDAHPRLQTMFQGRQVLKVKLNAPGSQIIFS